MPVRPTNLHNNRANVLAAGAGGSCVWIFLSRQSFLFSFYSLVDGLI